MLSVIPLLSGESMANPVAWYTAYWAKLMQSKPLTPAAQVEPDPPTVGPLNPPPPSQ